MSENTNSTVENASELATKIGVWVLTAAAVLATTEMLHNREHAALPTQVGNGHVASVVQEPITVRAEGTKESVRLAEEYDIGLRMPAIAGS
jgi:hypothetical protein